MDILYCAEGRGPCMEDVIDNFKASKGCKPLYFFKVNDTMWWISDLPTLSHYLRRCKTELPENELCPFCGQPDSCCGDCNCNPLTYDDWQKIFPTGLF